MPCVQIYGAPWVQLTWLGAARFCAMLQDSAAAAAVVARHPLAHPGSPLLLPAAWPAAQEAAGEADGCRYHCLGVGGGGKGEGERGGEGVCVCGVFVEGGCVCCVGVW